ncbi:hypothetical protein [Lichenihabitans psoromatis]|uniref:hypothetical protein n=1 Tax=Lichenihabitans psoromatis TaxID=2528642 RepID=UPI001FE0B7EE|nr:hypothetical protein [Lichenihabitans psoromatis]
MTDGMFQELTVKTGVSRSLLRVAVLAIAGTACAGAAMADCNDDFAKLMSKRMSEIGALNKISKSNGGKLDPIAACPRLKSLSAAEGEVVNYMTKNKEWCGLPDDLIEKMTASRAKTASIAVKACSFAVKMKQAQQQQAQQAQQGQQEQAVKLPTGPL